MKRSQLLGRTAKTTIDYDGDSLEVEYRTEVLSPEYMEALERIGDAPEPKEGEQETTVVQRREKKNADIRLVCDIVKSWTLTEDRHVLESRELAEGEEAEEVMYPITPERLFALSYRFVAFVGKAVLEAIANPTKASS